MLEVTVAQASCLRSNDSGKKASSWKLELRFASIVK